MTTTSVVTRVAAGLLIACASARCGQSSTTPSGSPASNITTSVAPTLADADVQISWTAAPGASSADVYITTTAGALVLQTGVGTAKSYHWQHAAPGNYFISIKSKVGNVTLSSSALGFQLAPLKQVIDALFFASGPMSDLKLTSDSATWTGAPRGASYDLVVLSTVAGGPLQAAVDQITQATDGQLSLTIKTVSASPSSLGPHQILITDTLTTCFGPNPPTNVIGVACGYVNDAQGRSNALIGFSPGNGQTPAVVLHEICHGLLGLSHTVGSIAYSPLIMSTTYSSQGVFSPFETAAIKAVYANGSVGPFSTRAAFRAAGLVE
jgi:hypothetical protein